MGYGMTIADLEKLNEVRIETVDVSALINAEEVEINSKLPASERMQDYLERIENPYCFMCGKTPVKVRFTDSETDLGKKLKQYFLSLKR